MLFARQRAPRQVMAEGIGAVVVPVAAARGRHVDPAAGGLAEIAVAGEHVELHPVALALPRGRRVQRLGVAGFEYRFAEVVGQDAAVGAEERRRAGPLRRPPPLRAERPDVAVGDADSDHARAAVASSAAKPALTPNVAVHATPRPPAARE